MRKNNLKKIMVVDDDPVDRILLRKVLSKSYIIAEASSGEEAVNLTRSDKPDLVLMDVMMPTIDGYNACFRIKRDPLTAEIPVVMLTGLKYKLNARLAERVGASGYLTKPFNPQDLLDTVDGFLKNPKIRHSSLSNRRKVI